MPLTVLDVMSGYAVGLLAFTPILVVSVLVILLVLIIELVLFFIRRRK